MSYVDLRSIDEWLEETITAMIRERGGRLQKVRLYHRLRPGSIDWRLWEGRNADWENISEIKRERLVRKTLRRMIAERKIEIRNGSGDSTYGEDYTRFIYPIGLLDRILAYLEDDDAT